MFDETVKRLDAWGMWTRAHRLEVNCSPLYRLMRANVGGVVSLPMPDDAEALKVDRCVARLKFREPVLHQVLWQYFVHQRTYHDIAEVLRYSRAKAKYLRDAAVCWIDGSLDLREAA